MSSFIEATGKKLFAKHLEKYTPEDPLYEFYTNKHGKQKRRKVNCPPFFNFISQVHINHYNAARITTWSLCS